LTGRTRRSEALSRQRHQRYLDLYGQIHDLAGKRVEIRAIAEQLGVSRGTVYRYVHMREPPTRKQTSLTHALLLDA
jgi:IS30 family transposase